jgi:hypothetical protein
MLLFVESELGLIEKMGKGWVKMQREITTSDGRKITFHFNYNKVTGAFDDFKYK